MTGIVLPLWIIVLLVVFATIGIVDRVFAPSVRWFFRRRVNQAIDELNQRLDMRIRPFRLTRRQEVTSKPTAAEKHALMTRIMEEGSKKALPGPSAARSQDYLYGDDGLPG